MNRVDVESPTCGCDEAVRNRKSNPPLPATFPPTEEGEIVCRFCWEVVT